MASFLRVSVAAWSLEWWSASQRLHLSPLLYPALQTPVPAVGPHLLAAPWLPTRRPTWTMVSEKDGSPAFGIPRAS